MQSAPKRVNHAETASAIRGKSAAMLVAVSVHQLVDFARQKSVKGNSRIFGAQGHSFMEQVL